MSAASDPSDPSGLTALAAWPRRRWLVAGASAAAYLVLVAVSTAMIPTPMFARQIAPAWWAWPALLAAAMLTGLLAGTYTQTRAVVLPVSEAGSRRGMLGAVLTWFAVGCPVCNKLVVLALGYAGALSWFQPVQPLLYLVALIALAWALRLRLRSETRCPVRPARR